MIDEPIELDSDEGWKDVEGSFYVIDHSDSDPRIYRWVTFSLTVQQDTDPISPREDDNMGTMLCAHKKYNLGDSLEGQIIEGYNPNNYSGWPALKRALRKAGAKVILPMYMLDHGGLAVSTTPFDDPRDSGQIGFIYLTEERIAATIPGATKKQLTEMLKAEVAVYNQYMQGDIWEYIIRDANGSYAGGCGGFYGEEAAQEAGKEALHQKRND